MSGDTARVLMRVSQGRVTVTPAPAQGFFRVQAQQYVGSIVLQDFDLLIRPKVTIENLLHLLGIGIPSSSWLPEQFRYTTTKDLLAAFAQYFVRATQAAIAKGLVRSYRQQRERVPALRGKIDFPVLLGQAGRPYPLPCVFDDYTADILENRTLRAATRRLLRLVGIQAGTRTSLLQVLARFDEVADEQINLELADRLLFTRLNKHYEAPIRLAALILRGSSVADSAGRVAASAFLIDMNDVFQRFLTARLKEMLRGRLDVEAEPLHHLALHRQIQMKPDLVFKSGGRIRYVADAKYKVTSSGRGLNADHYQLLAYATALNLEEGVLVYCHADGPIPPRVVEVMHAGKRLWTSGISLGGTAKEIDASVKELSDWILDRTSPALRVAVA